MKNLKITLIASLVLVLLANVSFAQTTKELTKQLKARSVKEVRQETKQLKKEGFHVAPGALPMEKQLQRAYLKQMQEDESGYLMYIVSSGNAVAETQSAAKLMASELAKFDLAGKIQTNVAAFIEGNLANAQLDTEESASVTEVTASIKNIIAQEIGRVIELFESYRKVGKGVEANIRIAYNSEKAKEAAKKVIREELKKKLELQHEKLEKLMDF